MKKSYYAWITLILLLGSAISSKSTAAHRDIFMAKISILNETPYTLKLTENFMVEKKRGYKGEFEFDQQFIDAGSSIEPGQLVLVGNATSWKYEIEGHFLFNFMVKSEDTDEDTDNYTGKHFDAHFSFARKKDNDTWFRLLDDNGRKYPLASAYMVDTCDVYRKASGRDRYHLSEIVIFTNDAQENCIDDSTCSEESFRHALDASRRHSEL